MAIVDIHTHIYPEKIAEKATFSVGDFYNIEMRGMGTSEHLLSLVANSPITHHVVHSVATTPKQVESINNFIAAECAAHPNFMGFATMHQDYENPEAEIDRCIALGLRGIKLHPDIQQVNLDDPRLMRVYEAGAARNLPFIIHTGDYRYDYSHPRRLVHVLHEFPTIVVDAAHFGGWSVFDLALEHLEDERCYVDVSSSLKFLGRRRTIELIQAYGIDRVMFGADFPMWNPANEYEVFRSLGFSEADYEKMCWRNAERFLNMEIN